MGLESPDSAPTETGLRAAPGVAPPSMLGFFKPSSRPGTVLVVVTTSAAEGVSAGLGRPILGVVLGQVPRTSRAPSTVRLSQLTQVCRRIAPLACMHRHRVESEAWAVSATRIVACEASLAVPAGGEPRHRALSGRATRHGRLDCRARSAVGHSGSGS